MAPNPDREFDHTHLSLDTAEARGFIHRDYLAHCLRWSHIARAAAKGFATHRWVDIGCGVDQPLARLLHVNKHSPRDGYYLGVDINPLALHPSFKNASWKPVLHGEADAVTSLWLDGGDLIVGGDAENSFKLAPPTHVVALEVLEHVQPAYCRRLVLKIKELLGHSGTAFISTPCYDAKVGAADNHINELTYQALGALFEDCGLAIVDHWGTFASQKDYKEHMSVDVREVFEQLKGYYDSNMLAVIFAPLFPQHARNCLWELTPADTAYQRRFLALETLAGPWTSSLRWLDLSGKTPPTA